MHSNGHYIKIVLIILFCGALGLLLGFFTELTENALYQTLSTIVEALSALVGIFGVFAVFRLDIQDREVREARDELDVIYHRERPDFVTERVHYTPPEQLLRMVEEKLKENPNHFAASIDEVIRRRDRLREAIEKQRKLKDIIRFPLIFMIITIGFSLAFLPLTGVPALRIPSYVRAMYMMVMIGFAIYALGLVFESFIELTRD